MKIISFTICPFVQRVTAMLEAKKIPYEVEFISLRDKPQWFLDISPNGQVPVLVTDDGEALFESEAIVEYLDEAYPPLTPNRTPIEKSRDRAWGYLAAKNYLTQCSAQRSSDAAALEERAAKLATAFDNVERALDGQPFFQSEQVGWVDIAWLPLLHRAAIVEAESGFDFLGERPKLKAWQANLLATGLPKRSVSPDFEAKFKGFYLSEKTFLGRCAASSCEHQTCAPGCC